MADPSERRRRAESGDAESTGTVARGELSFDQRVESVGCQNHFVDGAESPTVNALNRRSLLGLTAAGGLAALTGGTLYHAYTGPVALTVSNLTEAEAEVVVRLERDRESVAETTVTVPARGDDAPGRVERERFVERGRRGTTYTLAVEVPNRDVAETRTEYTQSCTGFSDIDGQRLGDHVGVDLVGQSAPESVVVDASSCSGIF